MINIIKRFFFLFLNSILDPKKFIFVLNKKLFSFPELKSLENIKNEFLKEKLFFFWITLAKKNNRLKKFFFENQKEILKLNFNFHDKKNMESNFTNCLAKYGIAYIENILPENENIRIQNDFYELQNYINQKNQLNNWLVDPVKTLSETKLRIYSKKKLSNYPNLNIISDNISKEITGKTLKSEAEFFFDRCLKLPDKKILGDNILHIDRYLPNFKIIYSPFDVKIDEAPFMYLPESHKINNEYKNMIFNRGYQNIENSTYKKFKNEVAQMTVKKNTLIVFLANGFHARSPFIGLKSRMLVFLQYNNAFNKLSLLNYKKFNSYKAP